jgi:DMSO/TMAO reductase YedYZ molybdopterin-dependent catalytic subunit
MRRPPVPTEASFTSTLRHEHLSARIGTWLGIAFGTCFLTGLVSHWYYLPDLPLLPPTRPVTGYRITQGVHVLTGIAAIPLLLVKLWSVYPRLFAEVPFRVRRELALHLLERASIAALVASAIFQLVTGLANMTQWYPWSFSFRSMHYALAWVAIGSLLVHVAVKLPVIRAAYAGPLPEPDHHDDDHGTDSGPSRRTILRTAYVASAVAVLAAAGNTVPWLRRVSVFAVRTGDGPQGVPINRSAQAAGVTSDDVGASYQLSVAHGDRTVTLSRADLESMRQRTHALPIACVEGWSAAATWTGVRFSDLLDLVDAPSGAAVRVHSLQRRGAFSVTTLPASFAFDGLTLLALRLNGSDLSLDHGFPCRLIAPNRPGVFQTKWVTRIEVLA